LIGINTPESTTKHEEYGNKTVKRYEWIRNWFKRCLMLTAEPVQQSEEPTNETTSNSSCNIKENRIGIYHVPGGAFSSEQSWNNVLFRRRS